MVRISPTAFIELRVLGVCLKLFSRYAERAHQARFNVTRNFVRRTLQDIAIVEAMGFFEDRTTN